MKKVCLIAWLFLAFFQLFADDDDKLKLAVMDLEDLSGKLSEETLSGASEYFRVIFAQTNRYIIISKDRQKDQIENLRKKYNTDPTYKSCTDKNCQIQLGQALSADLIVKTSVSFFAGSYTLASELIDLEKEATIIAATEEYDGSPQTLKAAIRNNVAKIVEAEKKENETTEEKISKEMLNSGRSQNHTANSKDQNACEYARKEDSSSTWKTYLSKYPDGECAAEAKEILDNKACAAARKKSTVEDWKKYLEEFPNGKCEFEATEKIENRRDFYSTDDKRFGGKFSSRWNHGLGVVLNSDHPNKIGFGTGFDFNFKVFEEPYGGGAGNLFVGFGFDFKYWVKTAMYGYVHDVNHNDLLNEYEKDNYLKDDESRNNLINIPIQANFGYEFKISNPTLRYIGLWTSLGMGIDMDVYHDDDDRDNKKETFLQFSFAWDISLDMIFKNGMLLNIGVGGNKSKEKVVKKSIDNDYCNYWNLDHIYLTFGTGVIF